MLQARFPVVLASASPRRRDLLSSLFRKFEIVEPSLFEENYVSTDPWATGSNSARAKADLVASSKSDSLVIAGDTVVAFESGEAWRQLGKPEDSASAVGMLGALSGKRHAVISAVAIRSPDASFDFVDTSWVTFRELSPDEIAEYASSGEPMDKAGAYAIQGGASRFVQTVEGELSTVIGLPIERLERELINSGLAVIYEPEAT